MAIVFKVGVGGANSANGGRVSSRVDAPLVMCLRGGALGTQRLAHPASCPLTLPPSRLPPSRHRPQDFSRDVLRIDAIPTKKLDNIRDWLVSVKIKWAPPGAGGRAPGPCLNLYPDRQTSGHGLQAPMSGHTTAPPPPNPKPQRPPTRRSPGTYGPPGRPSGAGPPPSPYPQTAPPALNPLPGSPTHPNPAAGTLSPSSTCRGSPSSNPSWRIRRASWSRQALPRARRQGLGLAQPGSATQRMLLPTRPPTHLIPPTKPPPGRVGLPQHGQVG